MSGAPDSSTLIDELIEIAERTGSSVDLAFLSGALSMVLLLKLETDMLDASMLFDSISEAIPLLEASPAEGGVLVADALKPYLYT